MTRPTRSASARGGPGPRARCAAVAHSRGVAGPTSDSIRFKLCKVEGGAAGPVGQDWKQQRGKGGRGWRGDGDGASFFGLQLWCSHVMGSGRWSRVREACGKDLEVQPSLESPSSPEPKLELDRRSFCNSQSYPEHPPSPHTTGRSAGQSGTGSTQRLKARG